MLDSNVNTFIQCAKAGSFNKAADILYISPNAVMKQINQLEARLGLQLFNRTKRGLKLTQEGKILFEEAELLQAHANKALYKAKALAESHNQTIRIGSSLLRPGKNVISLWIQVKNKVPDLKLQLVQFDDERTNYLNLIHSLGHKIDIICGLLPGKWLENNCSRLVLDMLPINVLVSTSHPFAFRKGMQIEDLYGNNLFMVKRGDTEWIDQVRDDLEKKHPQIHIIDTERYDIEVLNRCEAEKGIMISAPIWDNVHPSLVPVHVDWEYKVPYGIVYANNPSLAVKEFIKALKEKQQPL